MGSPYTQADIERARLRQHIAAGVRGQSVAMGDGARTMQVDAVLYHNARIRNQRDYHVDDCWAEKEFRDDMARRHPENVVKVLPTGIRVALGNNLAIGSDAGRLTRFGRVTFHKNYGDGRRN